MRRSHGVRRPGAGLTGRTFVAVLATLLAGGGAMVASIPAAAAPPLSCVVNSTASGAWAGGANCETSTPGQVTLRSAVAALNAAAAGAHSITFSLPNPSVITTSGSLAVSAGPLVVTGPGARALAVDGNGTHPVFTTGLQALTITGMTVRSGFSDGDGGGFDAGGPLTLDHVAVTGNTASSGGAIEARGTLTISNSLIARNKAAHAAGIDLQSDGGSSSLTNVTIADNVNTAANEGIGVEVAGTGALNLNFVTIAGNTYSGTPSSSDLPAAGVGAHDAGHINFHNSVIANNQGANCRFTVPITDTSSDQPGTSTDKGYNLDSANDCGFTEGAPKFDAVKAAANLGTLANNGGQTNTFALGSGSRAIDTADPACSVPTDQRGITRPQGIRCDMGAFEVLVAVAPPSPSATPVLPRAGKGSGGPSGGLLLGLVGFGILSALVLGRAIRTRRPIRS